MKNLSLIFILLSWVNVADAQTSNWKPYNYPFLGLKYEVPSCGFTDDEDCLGIGLLNEFDFEDFILLVGIVSKSDEEYTDEHPFPRSKTATGQLPAYTIDNYPKLKAKQPETHIFYDHESYCLRYFFPLKNNYVFKVEFEGYYEDFEEDEPLIKRFLESIQFYTPQATVSTNVLNQHIGADLKGKIKSRVVEFGDMWDSFTPLIKMDKQQGLYMLWVSTSKGVVLSQIDPTGKPLKNIELGFDKTYYNFELMDNGFALMASTSSYLNKDEQEPKYYREHLFIEAYDYSGKLKWKRTLMPEIVIKNVGDKGFVYTRGGCVSLASSGSHLLAYYSVNGKFDDGLVHQGDAITMLNAAGEIMDDARTNWYVSHSFAQKAVYDQDFFHLFALGDGYPRGINYTNVSLTQENLERRKNNIFPFQGECGDNYVGDTEFSNAISKNGLTYLAISTEENIRSKQSGRQKKENDIVLIAVDQTGKKVFEKNLTNTPAVAEEMPTLSFYGNQILVTWQQSAYYIDLKNKLPEEFILVNLDGSIKSTAQPFATYSILKMQEWNTMGNDLMTFELPGISNFVQTPDGGLVAVRFLPFYLSSYMEIIRIDP